MENKVAGQLPQDANREHIQTAAGFVTQDAKGGTTNKSPRVLSAEILTFVVPSNAIELILNPEEDLKVSEDPTMTTYDVVAAGTKESIPCSLMPFVYVQGSDTSRLNFRFSTLFNE